MKSTQNFLREQIISNRMKILPLSIIVIFIVAISSQTSFAQERTNFSSLNSQNSTAIQKQAIEWNNCQRENGVRNDNLTAISLAENSDQLRSKVQGFSYEFASIFNIFNGCKLQNVNVVFTITGSNGIFIKNVVVTEDPSLTKILNVSEQQGARYAEESSTATPEFPFAIPVLLVSITSLILFYRLKFR